MVKIPLSKKKQIIIFNIIIIKEGNEKEFQ